MVHNPGEGTVAQIFAKIPEGVYAFLGKILKGTPFWLLKYLIAFLLVRFSKIFPGEGGPISSPLPPNPLHSPIIG
jgi:hypothetical protein